MKNLEQLAPNFIQLVDEIGSLNPLQKKSIKKIINSNDEQYLEFAESVVVRMLVSVDRGECFDYLAKTYLWYTKLLRIEEMYYAQEGKYRYENFKEVYEKVYSRDDYMFDYVVGLGLSQPLWVNHYRIFRFFLEEYVPEQMLFLDHLEYMLRQALLFFHNSRFECPLINPSHTLNH